MTRAPYIASKADVWALGVCLYKCVSGDFPFTGMNESELYSKIKKGIHSLPDCFSKELKELMRGLLRINPDERLTVSEALESPWFHDSHYQDLSTKSVSTN